MSLEPYQWILKHAAELGVDPEHINAASADVCLGDHIIAFSPHETGMWLLGGDEREHHLEPDQPFTFTPGVFYLARTEEVVYVPATHAASMVLKSSTGRKGLNHFHSGFIDPGFQGSVTFEFQAARPVTFRRGQRIAQMVYHRLTEPTAKPYGSTESSHYQFQIAATRAHDE